jgi:hypothetical protein
MPLVAALPRLRIFLISFSSRDPVFSSLMDEVTNVSTTTPSDLRSNQRLPSSRRSLPPPPRQPTSLTPLLPLPSLLWLSFWLRPSPWSCKPMYPLFVSLCLSSPLPSSLSSLFPLFPLPSSLFPLFPLPSSLFPLPSSLSSPSPLPFSYHCSDLIEKRYIM